MRLPIYHKFIPILALTSLLFIQNISAKDLQNIYSWGYLLQNVTEQKVADSPFELVVIEPQLETDSSRIFSREAVNRMRIMPSSLNKRVILAYLSIGEAEDYRPYWQKKWLTKSPGWLGKVNPDWEGNYKVRFWEKHWQQIILQQLEAILSSGFDGVYLDIVDGWEYWSNTDTYKHQRENRQKNDPANDEHKAAGLMLDWLKTIGDYSRKVSSQSKPGFLVFPQNGERMLEYLSLSRKNTFWNLVSGIGVESVFFYGEKTENNPLNIDKERLKILSGFVERRKPVLATEYLTKPKLKGEFFKLARQQFFLPYAAVRELDRFMPQ